MYRLFAALAIVVPLGTDAPLLAQSFLERNVYAGRFDVRDFGAKGDGRSLDTEAIQSAVRAANKAGGGTITFPPGIYVTGTIELLSNVDLDIQRGATLKGSSKVDDYR